MLERRIAVIKREDMRRLRKEILRVMSRPSRRCCRSMEKAKKMVGRRMRKVGEK